jgi:ATP synthase protein I
MSDGTPPDPLSRLGEKIEAARRQRDKERGPAAAEEAPQGAFGAAFRIGAELVAALCVGLALGWVFDRVLGTRPWGLIGFFFLGAAAGMVNVFRAAQRMGR